MRSLLLAVRRRMLVKIFVAVALVVAAALLGLSWRQSHSEIEALKSTARASAEQLARVIVGNLEVSMLQGAGIHVKNQVQRTKQAVDSADIKIFDPRGLEVFGARPPVPPKDSLPPPLLATLADATRRIEGGRDWRPIANDTRCHECHPAEPTLRGVLSIAPAAAPVVREDVTSSLVRSAFVQVMSAEHDGDLTAYFAELSATAPTLHQIGVYGRGGDVAFGVEVPGVTPSMLDASMQSPSRPTRVAVESGSIELIPLVMEERCEQCHERDETTVRGVLAIAMTPVSPMQQATELAAVVDVSLRYIMMSSLGRMISAFLDAVVQTRAADEITLYDAEGRVYYTSRPEPAPVHVTAALASRLALSDFVGTGHDERVRFVHPLANDPKCGRCHGSDTALRGVVSVSLSTRAAAEARAAATRRATLFILVALALVLVVLYTLLEVIVVSPVRKIGAVADRIGSGQLDVSVPDVRPDGDEVDRLGLRINEMIRGLRTELNLRRFVSKGTAEAARDAAAASMTAGRFNTVGERCNATILFTDIRGFTAFSETVGPEAVVALLNRFLQVQADVVERYGGDIDKYVGDEVMAVFHGADGPARAVRAALEMVAAVEAAREHGEALAVGCGISTGEVVSGPIGSAARMDFTVIGDVVNTGARLCSAAGGSEVIVSEAVRDAVGNDLPEIELVALDPLQLKGKRDPLAVFRAVRR